MTVEIILTLLIRQCLINETFRKFELNFAVVAFDKMTHTGTQIY